MRNSISKNGIIQDKKIFKKTEGKCRLCGCDIYATLDVHRIKPGEKGGEYHQSNSICTCSNCHRRIHDEEIVIDKYYKCTSGRKMLRIVENGVERFV